MLTIKIVYGNQRAEEGFKEGWGFSCWVESGSSKILFDTGADAKAVFSNLQEHGIDCREITHLVYSHKHNDHIAGFKDIIPQLKKGSRLVLPQKFLTKVTFPNVKTTIVDDFAQIEPGVYSIVMKCGFRLYEQALILETEKGLVVITGCAHPGIIPILKEAQRRVKRPLYLVLGGFHLFRQGQKDVTQIIEEFKSLGVEFVAPCHCSGDAAIAQFQDAFPQHFYKIGTGMVLKL